MTIQVFSYSAVSTCCCKTVLRNLRELKCIRIKRNIDTVWTRKVSFGQLLRLFRCQMMSIRLRVKSVAINISENESPLAIQCAIRPGIFCGRTRVTLQDADYSTFIIIPTISQKIQVSKVNKATYSGNQIAITVQSE